MFSSTTKTGLLAALLGGAQLAAAHMEITFPPTFRSKHNPHSDPSKIDYTMTAPLAADGSNYPCKGYHSDFGGPGGESVATFAPGQTYNFQVEGGAPHGGGSCQVSLSYDRGATFTVIQSIIGGCPLASSYPFTIPEDAPTGEAIWAWTWSNKIGNREQYMGCSAVTIGGGAAKREAEAEVAEPVVKRASVPFSSRPPVFVANIVPGCSVDEGTDVVFPNPGPDVINNGGNEQPPKGSDCGAAGPAPAPAPAPSQAPVEQPAPVPTTPATTAAPAPTTPGGVFVTVPASSAAPVATTPVAAPTTLQTSTRPTPTSAPAAPAPAPVGGHAAGTACSNEGAWNCIGGTAFQRCASGAWSVPMQMAAGTQCTAGESDTLVSARVRRSRRVPRRAAAQLLN